MASHEWMENGFEGFICVPQQQRDNSLELLPVDGSHINESPLPFPFLPLEFAPLPVDNLFEYEQTFPGAAVNDLNMGINVNECPMDIPVVKADDDDGVLIPEHQGHSFSFPGARVDAIRSGHQTPNNMMTPYHGLSMVPDFENFVGANDRNFNNSTCHGVGNFDLSVLQAETQNSSRQPIEMYRNFTNFSGSAADEQVNVPGVYDNQDGIDSSEPNRLDKLDGRFLSLGYQSKAASNMNPNTFGRKADYMVETSLSPQVHLANKSFNNVRGSLEGFQNDVGGLVTPQSSVGCQIFSGDDSFRAMTSANDMGPISNSYRGPVNLHHYVPTLSSRTSESIIEANSRMYSDCSRKNSHMLSNFSGHNQGLDEYMNRRMQRVPFNSSILRSNHQNAADPLQNSYFSTNLISPPVIGESDNQDKSGRALGTNATSSTIHGGDLIHRSNRLCPSGLPSSQYSSGLLPARQNYPNTGHYWHSTGQVADIPVSNELHRASIAVRRESFKRNLDCPPWPSVQGCQRRKIMPPTLAQQLSPDLLRNPQGEVARGYSTPACNPSGNSSIIPSAVQVNFPGSGWTRNTISFTPIPKTTGTSNTSRLSQHLMAPAATTLSPIQISAPHSSSERISSGVPSSIMNSRAALAKTSTVGAESTTFEPPTLQAPPMAFTSTVVTRSDSARIPIPGTYSKKVKAAATSSVRRLASATALRKAHLLPTSANMTRPSLSERRKPLPALAKADPSLRASQVPSSMHRIKFQGFDEPPTVGFKCMLCKRDLSFSPEGPVVQPPITPAVAVLPCGHTFHDNCLLRITPEDQSKDPPCIPCAMGEE